MGFIFMAEVVFKFAHSFNRSFFYKKSSFCMLLGTVTISANTDFKMLTVFGKP